METFHLASLMSYHAIGKIKWGNIIGGSLMIFSLPLAYIFLKLGYSAYSVFVAIFIVNFIQMFFGWYIIHRYVPFRYKDLARKVYIPTMVITLLAVIPPYVIKLIFEEGWMRFIVVLLISEMTLLCLTYFIALSFQERDYIKSLIRSKLFKKL